MAFPQRRQYSIPSQIVENPDIMGGRPCVSGTRIPAETIIVQIRAGYGDEEIFRHYPGLPIDGIETVRAWAGKSGIDLTPDPAPA